jgi:hypothetical protein
MDTTSESLFSADSKHDVGESSSSTGNDEHANPSFTETFESIEAVLSAKTSKVVAFKNLLEAEAKLSLSSILVSLAISLVLVVICTIIWALLNTALALFIINIFASYTLAIATLLAINIVLGLGLYHQLKRVWSMVGLPAFTAALKE